MFRKQGMLIIIKEEFITPTAVGAGPELTLKISTFPFQVSSGGWIFTDQQHVRETQHTEAESQSFNYIYCKEKSRKISGGHFSYSALLTFIHSFILVYFYCLCVDFFFFFCMYVWTTVHAWYLQRSEEDTGPLRNGFTDGRKPPCGWKSSPGPL